VCAAQVAAFFIYKAGGKLTILKLIKLMYLAERLSLERYGEPITGDRLVSMPHGPALSITLNHINGFIESSPGGWDEWISDRENKEVSLTNPSMIESPEASLLALSDTDLEVLNEIWDRFGRLSTTDLYDYAHSSAIPEWVDPNGSSHPITYQELFRALGFSREKSEELIDKLEEQEQIDRAFA
jgi:uncharacterized phage-associated protein